MATVNGAKPMNLPTSSASNNSGARSKKSERDSDSSSNSKMSDMTIEARAMFA